jgi:hypothetical protein
MSTKSQKIIEEMGFALRHLCLSVVRHIGLRARERQELARKREGGDHASSHTHVG